MVQELTRPSAPPTDTTFPATAPAAYPVFYRTYSRKTDGVRETWPEVVDRTVQGLVKLGHLTPQEADLLREQQLHLRALTSGRWLWIGGTSWVENPQNFSGAYNCTSTNANDWRAFGLMMDLAMMGCGTGAVLEPHYINQLPPIRNPLTVTVEAELGVTPSDQRREETQVTIDDRRVTIQVGDSRQGWVASYQTLLELSTDDRFTGPLEVIVNLHDVRPAGEALKGFGGVANPVKLPEMYHKCAAILNKAVGRQLNSVECCLLIDQAAVTIVAGNIRRCLPEDALVHTDRGLVPIRDVQVGDRVQTPIGFRRVTNKFDQGIQDVYDVETNATFPRATLNHRMAVLADAQGGITWKHLGELQEGDRLLHNTRLLPGTVTTLPQDTTAQRPEQSRTAKPLTIPALTPEIAWLLGFTHGDGYVALGRNKHSKPYGRVEWAMNASQPELTQGLQEKIDRALALFGLHASHTIIKGENTAKSICSSIRLAEYFHQHIKQPNQPLVVPQCILQGSVDVRSAYLAGLMDSDGAIKNRPPHLLTTVYPKFANQVAAVLSSLGLASRITLIRPQVSHWQVKYNVTIPAFKSQYNAIIAPHSVKGELREGLKMNGFTLPGDMMRETYTYSEMQAMGFQGNRQVAANYERYRAESDVDLDIPVTVKGLGSHDSLQTYDIEVEEAHCFYCDGYLTHNSAGIRQFADSDTLGGSAKENLWQQDDQGNWRIDPERDALRMANHTRVYHHKPTLEEITAAVRKQFYSGEGAIQYAPESIARANGDLLAESILKQEFLEIYTSLGREEAKGWLRERCPTMAEDELEHRLQRYGLNPCVTGDTWVPTGDGPRQVQDLIGQQHSTYINGELFSTTPEGFFCSGVKPVVRLQTQEGYSLRLTDNHQVLRVTAQTQKAQYCEWVEAGHLQPGDRVLLHNHRGLQPWDGLGTEAEGWLLGNLVGDGCFSVNEANHSRQGLLRFWGENQASMAAQALQLGQEAAVTIATHTAVIHRGNGYTQINSAQLYRLAGRFGLEPGHKTVTAAIEQGSYEFYRGFLRGLFDADGSVHGNPEKGVSVQLPHSDRACLQSVQRMLLRLGIASTIDPEQRSAEDRLLPDSQSQPQPYFCQAQHELVISNDNLPIFAQYIGFLDTEKQNKLTAALESDKRQPNRERFTATVSAVVPDGVEAVYDCTVPGPARFDANGFVAHNCGEIIGSQFHCVAGDTLLITRSGMAPIAQLVGKPVEIWNGQRWSPVIPVQTGVNRQLYRVQFGDGSYLDVTEGHRFFVKDRFQQHYQEQTTAQLMASWDDRKYAIHTEPFRIDYQDGQFVDPIWAYTLGQLVGDGSVCGSQEKPQLQLRLYGATNYQSLALAGRTSGKTRYYAENPETPCLLYNGFEQEQFDGHHIRSLKTSAEGLEALATWNREAILHFMAGLADADGSLVPSGGIRIYLSGYDRAYRCYLLLLKCGIPSSINLCQQAGTHTNLGIRNKDLWYLQITDCAALPCQRLDVSGGHTLTTKGKWQVIRSIEPLAGLHDTFCFEEREFHKGVFGGTLTGQCNLSEIHLNRLNPQDKAAQEAAFKAGALSVAVLLNHQFTEERYRKSREWDPIVGVSFTGLFDFFVHAFGVDWLHWWVAGRPETEQGREYKRQEAEYLNHWREVVHQTVWDYCDRQGLRRPNRCTTVQPSGTKALLTGASSGWHPPKAARFIRRITFRRNDPVALACLDYGYPIVPSQSDKDATGKLLDDAWDPRCTEWLVEIPTAVSWADLPGADTVDISQFSALAQFDFYMQVQRHYTRHNTSATIELRESEIEPLAQAMYQVIDSNEGYISAALLARFDDHETFPRLPFEPIDRPTYDLLMAEVHQRRKTDNFATALQQYDLGLLQEAGPAGCDSDKCLLPEAPPKA